MLDDVDQELLAFRRLSVPELRARHHELFSTDARSGHKEHLVRQLAWQLQAQGEGGLSDRARQRACELMGQAGTSPFAGVRPPRVRRPAGPPARDKRLPPPGTVLVRIYLGRLIQVRVLEDGFEYQDQRYRSMTGIAKAITGRHWNGFHFFGLTKEQQA